MPEAKPEAKTEAKPEVKPETKPDPKAGKSFWEQLNTTYKSPGPARENFILQAIKSLYSKEAMQKMMVPLEVPLEGNKKLQFKVMPNVLSIEGRPVPLAYDTSRRLAAHYGIDLPAADMVRLIHQKADKKIPAKPLSGTGVTVDGKKYTGKEVVDKGVTYDPFIQNYADKYQQELAAKNVQPNEITSGFFKEYTKPVKGFEDRVHFVGAFTPDGVPIQGGSSGQGASGHVSSNYGPEYLTAFRGTSGTATIIENGKPVGEIDSDKALEMYKETPQAIKNPIGPRGPIPTSPIAKLPPEEKDEVKPKKPEDKKAVDKVDVKPEKAKPTLPTAPITEKEKEYVQKVDQMLESISSVIQERRKNIIKRAMQLGTIAYFLPDK